MNEIAMRDLISDFLKEVKKELPEWLKEKKEHKDILTELEDHVWNKAEELSETGQPTMDSVRLAITHMGTPKTIAQEYKRRGTPKVYITEELWPSYKNSIAAVIGVVLGINILAAVLSVIFSSPSLVEVFGNLISGFLLWSFIAFSIVTMIFAALSMQGYLPEDFKSKKEREKEEQELEKAREKGMPISKKTGKPLKPFINPKEEIIGGAIGLIFGLIFIIQPFFPGLFHPDFTTLLRFGGILILSGSSLDVVRGILGNQKPTSHQLIHVIKLGITIVWIPLLVVLMNNPQIFPWLTWDGASGGFINIGISPEYYGLYRGIMGLIIVITLLTTIEDIYRIIKLQKYKQK